MNAIKEGDRVKKIKGFQFPGIIVCMFKTTSGQLRCVVEAEHNDFKVMLHIYNPEQLKLRK
jgi:hypothetical protein